MKIAILTSVIGLGDSKIYDPSLDFSLPGQIDYYAFVDRLYPCRIWKQIHLPKFSGIDPVYADRRNAKLPKVLGAYLVPGYDYYIWHDNYAEVQTHPYIIVKDYLKENLFGLFRHPQRNCVYQEIETIRQYRADHEHNIDAFRHFLENNKYQQEMGLFELSSFIYKNCFNVNAFMLAWWELINRFSSRDQLSFPYLINKYQIGYTVLPGSGQGYALNNQFFPQVRVKGQ
jgi:hypothetical protein